MHRTGFGEPPCRHDAGGLLPHLFTLTGRHLRRRAGRRCALLFHFPSAFAAWGFPSALALRCPDFPRTATRPAATRPARQCSSRPAGTFERRRSRGSRCRQPPPPSAAPAPRELRRAACGGTSPAARARGATADLGRRRPKRASHRDERIRRDRHWPRRRRPRPRPTRRLPPGPKPPPIVLDTAAGRQEAVQGSYCVTERERQRRGTGRVSARTPHSRIPPSSPSSPRASP